MTQATTVPQGCFAPRYDLLDALRGIAAMLVVAFHAVNYVLPADPANTVWGTVNPVLWVFSRGAFGVTLFFVISGYCILATAHGGLRRGRGVVEFLKRRFRRIYPPFWGSLLLVLLLSGALAAINQAWLIDHASLNSPAVLSPFELFTNLTLTHTWLPKVLGTFSRTVSGVSWTLCYEEQFYAVCAFGILVFPRRFFTFLAVLAAVVGAFCVASLLRDHNISEIVQGTFLGPKWIQFAVGGLVYYRLVVAGGRAQVVADAILWFVPLSLTVALLAIDDLRSMQWNNQVFQLWVAAMFALTLRMIRPREAEVISRLKRLGLWSPLEAVGRMTYSLYLVHLPFVLIVSAVLIASDLTSPAAALLIGLPASMAVSLGASSAFYNVVERRFLNVPSAALQLRAKRET